MALFRIFRGTEAELNSVPLHEGYAYFTEDGGNLFIDVSSEYDVVNGKLGRVQVNAYAAQVLYKNENGQLTEIDVDDIFLRNMVASVTQGGTGNNQLTVNALLVGNGTDPIKMVSIDPKGVVVGDPANGVKSITGTGILYSLANGAPQIGVAPLVVGGTGASDAAGARTNLEVYSKQEVDTKVDQATSIAYNVTLFANAWIKTGSFYTYTYQNTDLVCGKAGNVPPVITYTSNLDEYSKIENAEATPGQSIVFTSQEQPANDIGLIIIDVK